MAERTAATSGLPLQRTLARPAAKATEALRTPGTLWIASVTWRAQLLHVMPVTCSVCSWSVSLVLINQPA